MSSIIKKIYHIRKYENIDREASKKGQSYLSRLRDPEGSSRYPSDIKVHPINSG